MMEEEGKVDVLAAGKADPNAVASRDRVTTKYMTKYERARVLGARALQIRLVVMLILCLW